MRGILFPMPARRRSTLHTSRRPGNLLSSVRGRGTDRTSGCAGRSSALEPHEAALGRGSIRPSRRRSLRRIPPPSLLDPEAPVLLVRQPIEAFQKGLRESSTIREGQVQRLGFQIREVHRVHSIGLPRRLPSVQVQGGLRVLLSHARSPRCATRPSQHEGDNGDRGSQFGRSN